MPQKRKSGRKKGGEGRGGVGRGGEGKERGNRNDFCLLAKVPDDCSVEVPEPSRTLDVPVK